MDVSIGPSVPEIVIVMADPPVSSNTMRTVLRGPDKSTRPPGPDQECADRLGNHFVVADRQDEGLSVVRPKIVFAELDRSAFNLDLTRVGIAL